MRGRAGIISLLLFACAGFLLSAQENGGREAETTEEEEVLPEPTGSLIDPVFPETKAAFIHFEAEEAVSTNFATTATLDYSASGYRTLQLNRYTGLFGGAAFYAEYVFYVEEPGEYVLYYGGTPPGPEDEVYPSYASPFSYSIDQGEMVPVHHEQVTVIERYMPNYYWVKFGSALLDEGVHRLRVEVSEKRKYDGKYLFYLDSFFMIDTGQFDRSDGVPKVFPGDLEGGNIDTFLKTVNDYRYLVSVEPENVDYLIEFSLIYAIIGDYLNALRNVNKAMLLDPDNAEAKRLAARYRLWKGEADEALKMYNVLLDMRSDLREVWAEAGKVAAWIGRYDDSINYYSRALEYYPDDLNLSVNRAITYLWESRESEAEQILEAVKTAVAGDLERTLELGEILIANGYPDRAITLYVQSIKENPEYLELYLSLVQAYAEAGKAEQSAAVYDQIGDRFKPSSRLDSTLNAFSIRESMKENVIRGFTDALAENPDNLALREQLVQAYFWNGRRKKAIEEYLNIIVNYAYISLSNFDRRYTELLELTDSLSIFKRRYAGVSAEIGARRSELESALSVYTGALDAYEKFDQRVQRAKDTGGSPPVPTGVHPRVALSDAESALADTVSVASEYRRMISSFIQRSEELLARRNAIVVEEQESRDGFVRLVADSGWRWDRDQMTKELRAVSDWGFVFADYVLGRIHSIHGEYSSAAPLLETAAAGGDATASYAAMQNSLWSGESAEVAVEMHTSSGYAPYLDELASLARELGLSPVPVAGIYTEATLSEVQSVLVSLDELEDDLELHAKVIDETLNVLRGIAGSRLERAIYEHQQETYLLRFELGDYYLLEGDYAETGEQARGSYAAAAEQLRMVLDIEPLNTSAVYKIGILYDRLGRWKRAMDSYAEVYEADPRFENVAAYYNQLARRHADTADIRLQLSADASRIGQKSTLALGNEFNSVFSLRTLAETETVRMYQDFDNGVDPWIYQVHGFALSLPLTIQTLGLSLTPTTGVQFRSSLINDGITAQVNALNPLYIAGSYEIEPELGGELFIDTGDVSVTGTYRYGRYEESYKPGVRRLISHSAAASARLGFTIFNRELLRYSSVRVGGEFDLLFDATGRVNTLYGLTEKLELVFHLADSPWTNFTISQLLDYQGSQTPGAVEYYAPQGNLQISGGLGFATWIALSGDTTIGLIFNVTPGALISGSAGSNEANSGNPVRETQAQTGADLRVELKVADVTYFAAAQLSGSAAELPGLDYWSASVNIGVNARLPRLLAE